MGIWLLHKPEDGFVDYLTNIKPGGGTLGLFNLE